MTLDNLKKGQMAEITGYTLGNAAYRAKLLALGISLALIPAAATGTPSTSGYSYEPGAGISFHATPIVTAEFGVSFDSRYMTYGVIDGNMRKAAAAYNGEWGAGEYKTWNVVGGLSLTATF